MIRPIRWTTPGVLVSVAVMVALLGSGCTPTPKPVEPVTTVVEKEKGTTLILVANTSSLALSCKLSKQVRPDEDHVRWYNQTTGSVTITFTATSPFLGGETTIVVPPGKRSAYYTVDTDKVSGPYPYKTTPRLISASEGPGEPGITVED